MRRRLLPILLVLLLCAACGRREDAPSQTHPVPSGSQIDADALLEEADVAHYDCKTRGHIFSAATCQAPATCYYCGQTQGEKGAHDFTHATCLHKRTCTVCGLQTGDYAAHLYTAASCAGPASCAVCGAVGKAALGHHFLPATCVSPSRCSGCMRTKGSALGHQWTGGSCTEPQTCTRCSRQLPAPGHRMTDGSCTQDAVCTVCGYTVKAKGHQFDEKGVCTVCGQTKAEASRAEASVRASLAQESELQTQTTEPPVDTDALLAYADTLETVLQQVHDTAHESISKSYDEREQMLTQAVEQLRTVTATIDEAEKFCDGDARTAGLKKPLEAVRKAIRSDAAIRSFSGVDTVKTAVDMRANATAARKALAEYVKAVKAL